VNAQICDRFDDAKMRALTDQPITSVLLRTWHAR